MLQHARNAWNETPQLTKTLCEIMPAVGCCLVALGVTGDQREWWDGRAFLTNLLTSFTGLMFAVPFALLVLSRLGEAHSELADQRAARRIARDAISRLTLAIDRTQILREELDEFIGRFPHSSRDEDSFPRLRDMAVRHKQEIDDLYEKWIVVRDVAALRLIESGLSLQGTVSIGDFGKRISDAQSASDALALDARRLIPDSYGIDPSVNLDRENFARRWQADLKYLAFHSQFSY
ncbi:hypothetical protein HLK59_22870 [Streptomyces sp. S3(2020)]|uniref:hypothetical protein n=1 Tax=Streptomyces sp. S3(2020) TaxID=2732044 RepID=UPI001487BCC2|nr:hypothetical protein [Streptomyces sp. S3(2020)]NNN33149.1 hypothetical protein [Streptomyces sp. S3(2020)]